MEDKRLVEVILHDDDTTTMQDVVLMLTTIFNLSDDEAAAITQKAHKGGHSSIGKFSEADAHRRIKLIELMANGAYRDLRCTISGDSKTDSSGRVDKTLEVIPKGWHKSGLAPGDFRVMHEEGVAHSGTKCASMQSITRPSGFGTLMSSFGADEYLDKRLRMRLWVKTDPGSEVAPWMRIDSKGREKMLGFDNFCERSITGQTDWTEYQSVLDVPKGSTNIAFGVMLMGTGKFYVDDVSFEVVDKDVPTTDCACYAKTSKQPTNLNFEE
jgi:ATP-dependent Clp protease adapter protein ClpS